jgi:hypothetical protein
MSEQRTFVFAVTFIVVFSALIGSIPVDFQGQGSTVETLIPVNPNLLSDFSAKEEYDKTDFSGIVTLFYVYELPVDGTTFECNYYDNAFSLAAHTLFVGLWLGGMSWVNFISDNGTNHGLSVSFSDLENDAEEGAVRYTLQYEDTGNSAGGFVFYWNTTTYVNPSDAWDSDELYLLHGVGITASTDIASLLLALMFLQLPEVPTLVNVLIITPMWAGIIFVLWFIIKSMIPLLG